MLSADYLETYADVLLWAMQASRREHLRNGAVVLLRYDLAGLPLAEAVYARLLDRHYCPVQRMNLTTAMERDFYVRSAVKQLTARPPGEKELYENLDGAIHILAPDSLTHLADADPERIGMATTARRYLRDILDERERQGVYGWTLCLYPTPELARSAGLSPEEYAEQVVRACRLNTADPVQEWKLALRDITEIRRWLSALQPRELRVQSASMDLRLAPGERRRWLGLTGHNIPSFEVYLSPDWRGTEGVYFADLPSYRSGNLVEKTRLEFRKGRVVRAEAETGGRFLAEQLAMDEGACRVGEFSLTDRRFSGIGRFMAMTLYDENFGGEYGNCHLALGSSYAATFDGDPAEFTPEVREQLGFNASALHWDLVNTEPKTVTARLAGGRDMIIYENGEFAL